MVPGVDVAFNVNWEKSQKGRHLFVAAVEWEEQRLSMSKRDLIIYDYKVSSEHWKIAYETRINKL